MAPRVTVLCGGLGGARLALALKAAGIDEQSCFVTNVGDDIEVAGLLVCPDTDAVLYALAGQFDEERGWGIRGDTFPGPRPGEPPWFNLGSRDRQHHERRRALLDEGRSLGEVTVNLAKSLGVRSVVVPATDDSTRTRVRVGEDWLGFQEWLIRDHASSTPDEVRYEGKARATASPAAVTAVTESSLVVLAPSSPVASLGPMLALPELREALASRSGPTLAISPVAARRPPIAERDQRRWAAREALLAACGIGHAPVSIAKWCAEVVDTFVLDPVDIADRPAIEALGLRVIVAPTVAGTAEERAHLAEAVLNAG